MNSSFLNVIFTIFRKEAIDALRDRRMVMGAMAFTIVMPILMVSMMNFLVNRESDEEIPVVALVGSQGADGLVEFLQSQDLDLILVEPETHEYRDGLMIGVQAVIMVDKDFVDHQIEGRIANLRIYVDQSNRKNRGAASKVDEMLEGYASHQAQSRLLGMGVPPMAVKTISIQHADLSTGGARAKSMAFNLLYIFILTPFVASMSVAIDMTAGERERKSLQSLLSQPVTPMQIVLGKWMLAALFGLVGVSIVVFASLMGLKTVPLEVIGLKLNLDSLTAFKMMVVFYPLCLLSSAAQMLVSLTAKNYKEATLYQQFLTMAPILIGAISFAINDSIVTGLKVHLPILSHLHLAQNVLLEGQFDGVNVLISAGICIALAAVCLYLTSDRLKSEKILSAA